MASLPPPDQTWAHGVASQQSLREALADDKITAIETDLCMGTTPDTFAPQPIHAHPPAKESDLSMVEFLRLCSSSSGTIQKVIKLDFKDFATVEPTLEEIVNEKLTTGPNAVILLNADVLPGPGNRHEGAVKISPATFCELCLPYLKQSSARIAFSLGYKCDSMDPHGYTPADADAMAQVIEQYKLEEFGVVLALNARQLAKSKGVFDSILDQFPQIQILAWTGKGELEIPLSMMEEIDEHFEQKGTGERIGYDCQITDSELKGKSIELFVSYVGRAKNGRTAQFMRKMRGSLRGSQTSGNAGEESNTTQQDG